MTNNLYQEKSLFLRSERMAVNDFTQNMIAKFPSWMKMAKDENSIGAQFLNVFGMTFEEFEHELTETVENFYLETAHIDMIDILYKIPLTSVRVDDIEKIYDVFIEDFEENRTLVMGSKNLREFYRREVTLPKYFIDRSGGYLYLRIDFEGVEDIDNPFQSLIINEAKHYTLDVHHVWNAYDEFGLLFGLSRLPRERNESFKKRILDVFKSPGGNTQTGIKNALARELGLSKEEVNVFPFHDRAFGETLIHPDGTPTEAMVRYAKQINENLKFTWDTLNLGEAYWYSIEQDNLGIDFLPHIWDVDTSLFKREEFQSGVGDKDDLLVTAPEKQSATRNFRAYVSLVGYFEDYEEFFPEIAFQYKIYGQGKRLTETYEEEPFKYTVEAAEVFEQNYRVIASQEFPYTFRTEFYEKNDFVDDADRKKINFGKSNDILHTQTDGMMKLIYNLSTSDDSVSNWVPEMNVVWEDTAGGEHAYPFKTNNDFLIPRTNAGGEPETFLAFADVSHGEEGLGLGYGAFVSELDTTVEWQQGEYETDTVLIKDGTVSLNLDYMSKIMN